MKTLLLFMTVVYAFSSEAQPSTIEKKIIDTIWNLKEVKDRSLIIEQQSNWKRHLEIAIYQQPEGSQTYYWIKAWEDNGTNYATHFNFFVYPKTLEINFYDAITGKEIRLKEWRQKRLQ